MGFPEHGLVVMPQAAGAATEAITKGVTTEVALITAVKTAWDASNTKTAHIETDMRAHINPTRMQVIGKATENLVQAITQRCPVCNCPGFTIVRHNPGLPCAWCGTPTRLTRSTTARCQRCQHEQTTLLPQGESTADPGHCPYCNP